MKALTISARLMRPSATESMRMSSPGKAMLVQLVKPEVIPCVVRVWRSIWIPSQVTDVLHQHDCRVVLPVINRTAIDHGQQSISPSVHVARTERGDGCVAFGRSRYDLQTRKQVVDVGSRRACWWEN